MTHEWGSLKSDHYPRLMFLQSPTMRRNSKKYGDKVIFEVDYKSIWNRTIDGLAYKLGYFFVQDTNGRPLLSSVVIFCE